MNGQLNGPVNDAGSGSSNEPKRLLDSVALGSDARRLLEASELPTALPEATRKKARIRARVLSAGPAFATVSWFSIKAAASTVTTGVVSTGVTLAALYAADATFEFSPLQDEATTAVEASAPVVIKRPLRGVAPASVEPKLPAEPYAPTDLRPRGELPGLVEQDDADRLQAESALLERARRMLNVDARQALAVLKEHAALPDSQLATERELIEIEALRRLGRSQEARARAQRLLKGAPNGLYADRIRSILDKLPASPSNAGVSLAGTSKATAKVGRTRSSTVSLKRAQRASHKKKPPPTKSFSLR